MQVLASPANGIARISEGYPIHPISVNEAARGSWAAIPRRTLVQFDNNSYIDGTSQFFDDYVGLELDVQNSAHVSSPAVMNGAWSVVFSKRFSIRQMWELRSRALEPDADP